MLGVVWFGSQIISGDAAETAPTETTTAFRGLFEQTRGVAAQYNIRPPSGPRGLRTDTHQARRYSFGRYSNAGLWQNTSNALHQVPLRTNGFQDTATQSVTTNQHPNARCSATSSKERPHPVTN
jgi:hypothetical protein